MRVGVKLRMKEIVKLVKITYTNVLVESIYSQRFKKYHLDEYKNVGCKKVLSQLCNSEYFTSEQRVTTYVFAVTFKFERFVNFS